MQCEWCKNIANPVEEHDIPLAQSKFGNFIAWVSVGALVPGYMLVLPRRCYTAMAAVPRYLRLELAQFTYDVAWQVKRLWGPDVVLFEHGPICKRDDTVDGACVACVDHAHIHIVPIPHTFNVAMKTAEQLRSVPSRRVTVTTLSTLMGWDYLFIEQPSFGVGLAFLKTDDAQGFRSQLIRNVIADEFGLGDYNWRTEPRFENVAKTIEKWRQR